ncbi:MAG: sugar phosphate nucleotidyltransferase [Candidatus Micrarchaeales archaeon]|jgi:glucose-1-phosphate thymidylyltransferase
MSVETENKTGKEVSENSVKDSNVPSNLVGVLLAAGIGKRLRPLTNFTPKVFLPVYNKPLVFYPLELLKDLGVNKVVVVASQNNFEMFKNMLGDGESLGLRLEYVVQEKPMGTADAVNTAKTAVKGERILVMPADTIYNMKPDEVNEVRQKLRKFESSGNALLFVKRVKDPKRFGVVEIDGKGGVVNIEEKPENPKSNFILAGMYAFDETVFKKISEIGLSVRGELEITDAINRYIQQDGRVDCYKIKGGFIDTGTFEDLFRATKEMRKQRLRNISA